MDGDVQLKAKVPQSLKRQAFSVMALRGIKFSPWVREQLRLLIANQKAVEQDAACVAPGETHDQTQ